MLNKTGVKNYHAKSRQAPLVYVSNEAEDSLNAHKAIGDVPCYIGHADSGKSKKIAEKMLMLTLPTVKEKFPVVTAISTGRDFGDAYANRFYQINPSYLGDDAAYTYKSLHNTKASAINIFDTQIGCKELSPNAYNQALNFLKTLIVPIECQLTDDEADPLITLLGDLIDRAFFYVQGYDARIKKMYVKGCHTHLDEVVTEYGVVHDHMAVTAAELVDRLHVMGLNRHGSDRYSLWLARDMAHKQSVPVLLDFFTVLNMDHKQLSSNIIIKRTGETLTEFLRRRLHGVIEDYPCFSHPTQFDINQSYASVIDLQYVITAKGLKADANSMTASIKESISSDLAFLQAAHKIATDKIEAVRGIDNMLNQGSIYTGYHAERTMDISQSQKTIVFDNIDLSDCHDCLFSALNFNFGLHVSNIISVNSLSELFNRDDDGFLLSRLSGLHFFNVPTEDDMKLLQNKYPTNKDVVSDFKNINDEVYLSYFFKEIEASGQFITISFCKKDSLIESLNKMVSDSAFMVSESPFGGIVGGGQPN